MLKRKVLFVITICVFCFVFLNISSFSDSENWFSSYYDWGKNIVKEVFSGEVYRQINDKLYIVVKYFDNMLCKRISKRIDEVRKRKETKLNKTDEEELRMFFKEILNVEMREFKIEFVEKDNYYFNFEMGFLRPFEPWLWIRVNVDGIPFTCMKGTNDYKKIFCLWNNFYQFCCDSPEMRRERMEREGFFDISWRKLGPEEVSWENVKRVLRYYNLPDDRERIQTGVQHECMYHYKFNEFIWDGTPVRGARFECCTDGFTGKIVKTYCVQPISIKNNKPEDIIHFEEGKQIVEKWYLDKMKGVQFTVGNIPPQLVIAPNVFMGVVFKGEGYLPLDVFLLYEICNLLKVYRCGCDEIKTSFRERPGYFYAYEMVVICNEEQAKNRTRLKEKHIFISPDTKEVIGYLPEERDMLSP